MSQFFRYAVDLKFVPMWGVFGVRPSKDGVTLTDDGRFKATFGFLRLETALDNVRGRMSPGTTDGGRRSGLEPRSSMTG